MAVAVNTTSRDKESALDKVLKASQLAGSLFGIYADVKKVDALKSQQDRESAAAAKESARKDTELGIKKTEFDQKQAHYQEQNDPNSLASQIARREATRAGLNVPANFTAAQVGTTPGLKDRIEASIKASAEQQKLATEPPKPNQSQAALFGRRMEQAEDVFGRLDQEGFDRTWTGTSLKATFLPEALKPAQIKQQEQAERNFVNAVLRRESGAAISPQEFKSAEVQYFPRAGDDPQTTAQKAENRKLAIEAMRLEAGPAWNRIDIASTKVPVKVPGSGGNGNRIRSTGTGLPGVQDAEAKQMPEIGSVQKGYRFKGGDPSDQANWIRVK